MAADGVGVFVREASGDPLPGWEVAFRQLEEKMLNRMRLQEETLAALDQKVQEANGKLEEAKMMMEKNLKGLEKRVADLEGRYPVSAARGSAGGQEEQEAVHLATEVTETREQRKHESVRRNRRMLETLLSSSIGTGGQEETGIMQHLSAQLQKSVNQAPEPLYPSVFSMEAQQERTDVAGERRKAEHLETHMYEEYPVLKAPESTSHRGNVPGSAEQWPVLAAKEMAAASTKALFDELKGAAQDTLKIVRSGEGTLESLLERFPVTGGKNKVDDMESGARGSALESSLEKTRVADSQEEAEHPETDKEQEQEQEEEIQEELTRQTAEPTSNRGSDLEPLLQTPVLAPRQGEAGLAERTAQAPRGFAGFKGGPLERYLFRQLSEMPPARTTSGTTSSSIALPSSSSAVSEGQDAPPIASLTESHLEDLSDLLIKATRKGREDEVRRLLHEGADVNAADEEGETPLMLAARNGDWSLVVPLLFSGADRNAVSKKGYAPLHFAAAFDTTGQVVTMLLNAGANKDCKEELGRTPLHMAAYYDNKIAAFELHEGGASKTSTDAAGRTPYDYAKSDLLRHILRP